MVLHQPLSTHTYIYIHTLYIHTYIHICHILDIHPPVSPFSTIICSMVRYVPSRSAWIATTLLFPCCFAFVPIYLTYQDVLILWWRQWYHRVPMWQARCRFCCGIVMCLIFWADVVRGDVSPTKVIWHTCSGASACKPMSKDDHEALELGGVPLVHGSGTKRAETHIVWR